MADNQPLLEETSQDVTPLTPAQLVAGGPTTASPPIPVQKTLVAAPPKKQIAPERPKALPKTTPAKTEKSGQQPSLPSTGGSSRNRNGAVAQIQKNLAASADSILSLRNQPKIITGARIIFRINQQKIAFANSINYTIETEWTENSGIDEDVPNELVPGMVRCRGTINVFRVPNSSAAQNFWQSDMLRMRVWPYSEIEVRDQRTDELIIKFPRIAVTARTEQIAPGQLTITQLSFISIGYRDELTPQSIATGGSGIKVPGLF